MNVCICVCARLSGITLLCSRNYYSIVHQLNKVKFKKQLIKLMASFWYCSNNDDTTIITIIY